eukprot:TRINITY_DN5596_c0_g1_i3.p1 TRINITY_DN5596_c0_g1~~TRINITY_DN5596_c0_g1_i3.p1  ORF type:complete len:590 (-),score=149.18 TRINITY_DN5596_c0_g1_i3:242-2011(-)
MDTKAQLMAACREGRVDRVHALTRGSDIPPSHGFLYEAARAGHLEVVRLLLRLRTPPRITNDSNTAFTAACGAGHMHVVRLLLKEHGLPPRGASVAMEAAAAGGHLPLVRLLLRAGAPTAPGVLSCAADSESEPMVRELIELGASHGPYRGLYAVDYAAARGNAAIVSLLLRDGAQLHVCAPASHWGRETHGTAVTRAIGRGSVDTLRVLCSTRRAVRVTAKVVSGEGSKSAPDALCCCWSKMRELKRQAEAGRAGGLASAAPWGGGMELWEPVMALYERVGERWRRKLRACEQSRAAEAGEHKAWLEKALWRLDEHYRKVLAHVASSNMPLAVASLVQRGVHMADADGRWDSALEAAVKGGAGHSVRVLLEADAPRTLGSRRRHGSLLSAACGRGAGSALVVQHLLAAGEEAAVADVHGVTPLLSAAEEADAAVAELLVGAGARAGVQAAHGVRAHPIDPLAVLVASRHKAEAAEAVERTAVILLHAGADMWARLGPLDLYPWSDYRRATWAADTINHKMSIWEAVKSNGKKDHRAMVCAKKLLIALSDFDRRVEWAVRLCLLLLPRELVEVVLRMYRGGADCPHRNL